MKVKIKNFQIIKNANLEFNPGITAIVGDSNNGKSSIIRAIEYAINNKGGSGFINYDVKACDVIIEDNDHVIKWHKDEASRKSYYEIDGKKLSKIGQKQLDEVGELLNMSEIEIGKERFRLNFWKQMEYPFLVGKTPYQLFDFISRSEEQELMQELKENSEEDYKLLKKDMNSLESQIDMLTNDVSDLDKEIEDLEKFSNYNLARLEALSTIYKDLNGDITWFDEVSRQIEANSNVKKAITKKVKELEKLFKSIDSFYKFRNDVEPIVKSVDEVISSIEENTILLDEIVKDSNLAENKIKRLKGKIDEIDKLSEDAEQLKQLIEEYSFKKHATSTEESNIVLVQGQIEDLIEELSKFKVCPLCGGSLEGDECSG